MSIMTIDDTSLSLVGIGSIITPYLSLLHVYHISKLTLNLISIG